MVERIRCLMSCIFPCGSLDVIRIVHVDGRVDEICRGGVIAGDITRSHPNHVLRKAPSPASVDDCSGYEAPRRAVVLPPTAELQRGRIYFLVPVSAEKKARAGAERNTHVSPAREKKGRAATWRPRLESISEKTNSSDGLL